MNDAGASFVADPQRLHQERRTCCIGKVSVPLPTGFIVLQTIGRYGEVSMNCAQRGSRPLRSCFNSAILPLGSESAGVRAAFFGRFAPTLTLSQSIAIYTSHGT